MIDMTLLDPNLVIVGAAAAAGIGYAVGIMTARCSETNPCPKCAFHVNAQRMKGLEADRVRIDAAEKQAKLRHDAEHKGWGWHLGDPDILNCEDTSCPRNKESVSSDRR